MSKQQLMTFFSSMASTLCLVTGTPVAEVRDALNELVCADLPWEVIQGMLANQEAITVANMELSGVTFPSEQKATVKPS